ncbi:MAG: hypothetical protein KGN74_14535 [Gemmatimonadota bacterium]|nr:hypothetical protein [Gemmatimonadota bacterium]
MHDARIRARARGLPRAFLDELTRAGEDDASAQAAVAGLVVLRVVDRWVAGGCPGGFDVVGAMAAVSAVDAGQPVKALLAQVLEAVAGGGPGAAATTTDRLLQYGRALELDAKWSLALAVYDSVVSHAGVGSSDAATAFALTRQGYCFRVVGAFDESRGAYRRGQEIAQRAGDLNTALLAELGRALTEAAQGTGDDSESAYRDIALRAARAGLRNVECRALHERAVLAGNRGQPLESARLAYAALERCDVPADRDSILNDLGESLRRLGLKDAARDAFLVLSCTASPQYTRWMAIIHLMRIAGEDGAAAAYRAYRRDLERQPLPPQLKIEMETQSGYALRALGMAPAAGRAFRRAISQATEYGFTSGLSELRRALAGGWDFVPSPPERTPRDLVKIVKALREMREATVVA